MKHKTILETLCQSLLKAADYNKNAEVAPAAVLWTDEARLWEPLLPELRERLPGLLTLGPWQPALRQGPAYWLRCALAGALPEVPLQAGTLPLLYLPGVSRARLREVSSCPVELHPLVELQFRGAYWTQANSKDWTPLAYISGTHGGLGLDVSTDALTRQTLLRCLPEVFAESALRFENKRIDADVLTALLDVDINRDMLRWMENPTAARKAWSEAFWVGFVQQCEKHLSFSPDKEDELSAAEQMAHLEGGWKAVWHRFKETPGKFPGVIKLLAKLSGPKDLLTDREPFVALNDAAEVDLCQALQAFADVSSIAQARDQLAALESEHGLRRQWVWAETGRSPLAEALGHLVQLDLRTQLPLTSTSPQAMREQYEQQAWEVDAAMLDALACVREDAASRAVEAALALLYKPWLEQHAESFQQAVKAHTYEPTPAASYEGAEKGLVVFFVDGLRYDAGKKLCALLTAAGHQVTLNSQWTSVPSVTASGKVLVSPAAVMATGEPDDEDFEPCHKVKKQPLKAPVLRKTLQEMGWQVLLDKADLGDPSGKAWVESGDIDQYGHANQLRLAQDLHQQLAWVRERIEQLLKAGWSRIRIVTDHGWLLVPGKLDKVHLEKDMAETTWGRAAKLKKGAPAQVLTLPWSWCPEVHIALAPGARSFKAGEHYSHGGLSLQESLTPLLEVCSTTATQASASILEAKWSGLRLRVTVQGEGALVADLRTKPSSKESSIVEPQDVKDGKVSLLVHDEKREGESVTLVLLNEGGQVLAKSPQVVGG